MALPPVQQSAQVSFYATAIATIGVWAMKQFWKIDVPGEVGLAFGGLLGTVINHLVPNPGESVQVPTVQEKQNVP